MKMTENSKVPYVSKGILIPAMTHRWRLLMGVGTKEMPEITEQVTKFQFDLATGKASFDVQIPVVGSRIESYLRHLCKHGGCIVLEIMQGNNEVGHSVRFEIISITKCFIDCDYSKNGALTAQVELTFDHVKTTQMIDGKEQSVD